WAQQWPPGRGATREDEFRCKRNQFCRVFALVILIAYGPTRVDLNAVSDGPSQLLQPLQKCRVAGLHLRGARRPGHERAHAPHLLPLLRACRERPCSRCAAERRSEFSSSVVACHVTLRLGVIHAMEE